MPLLTVKLAKEVFGYHTTLWGIGKPALVASHMEGAIQNKCLGKLLMHLTQQVDLQELTAALSTCWQGAICYKLEHTVPLFNNSSLRIWITFLPCWTWESAVIQLCLKDVAEAILCWSLTSTGLCLHCRDAGILLFDQLVLRTGKPPRRLRGKARGVVEQQLLCWGKERETSAEHGGRATRVT